MSIPGVSSVSTSSSKPVGVVGWARVFPAFQRSISKALRRGAWYPVVADTLPDRVSIKLGHRAVAVPRRLLEMRRRKPDQFSVITRSHGGPNRHSPEALGPRYVVCPACAGRQPLWGKPELLTCRECGHDGTVAWWEA